MSLAYTEADKQLKKIFRKREIDRLKENKKSVLAVFIMVVVVIAWMTVGIALNLGGWMISTILVVLFGLILFFGIYYIDWEKNKAIEETKKIDVEVAYVRMIGREHIQDSSQNIYSFEVVDANSVMEEVSKIRVSLSVYNEFKVNRLAYVVKYGNEGRTEVFYENDISLLVDGQK